MSVFEYTLNSIAWGALGYLAAVINYRLKRLHRRGRGGDDQA